MSNKIIREQLDMLKTLDFQVDGKPSKDFPEFFTEVVFLKNTDKVLVDTSEKQMVFADYIVTPFEGFDFHDKFNKGVPPPEKVMFGYIVKQTEKMYMVKVRNQTSSKIWTGWVPKKSISIS